MATTTAATARWPVSTDWTSPSSTTPTRPSSSSAPDTREAPERSRSERLWAHPGLRPSTHLQPTPATPLLAYRWEYTDRALAEQLALETEGYSATVEPGHTAVRCTNPTTGADVLPTLRTEFHRLAPDTLTAARSEVGSSFFEVSTVRATSPSATRAGTSNAATCSSCPPGSR
nr:hypothetical protein [Streptomyces guryensis]